MKNFHDFQKEKRTRKKLKLNKLNKERKKNTDNYLNGVFVRKNSLPPPLPPKNRVTFVAF